MRTITAAQQAVLDSGTGAEFVRVFIKDSGGTFRDLTTYPGFNAVKSVEWGESVTEPHMTCDIMLLREFYNLSLSPYKTSSPVNKAFNPATTFAALIAQNRELKIEVAIVPEDKQPASGDWMEVFRGRVDDVDTASGWNIKVSCRSLGGRLAQQFIKTELVYSFAAVSSVAKALRIWEPQIPVVLNVTYLLPASRATGDSGVNKFFKCSQSGTTGTTEPTWSTGSNIVDGSAKWDYVSTPSASGNPVEQIMQNILDDHKASSDPSVTLYTPSSPGWAIREFLQSREYVLDALLKLAGQIGWDLRYKWRSGTGQFELTFYAPTRSSPTVLHTFAVTDYENPTRLFVSIAQIRNSWRIVYSDRSDLLPDSNPKRKVIEVSDSTSIAKYGELWAEIQEDENSQIDSSTEATALVNAALSDCKEPTAELSVQLTRGFPWVEINDYYTFTANNLHFDVDQSLAVTSWSHSIETGSKMRSKLEVRGLPTIGAERWISNSEHIAITKKERPAQLVSWSGGGTATVAARKLMGGAVIAVSNADNGRVTGVSEYELHVSKTANFTPSSTTLQGVIKDKITTVQGLQPAIDHYTKLIPRSRDAKGKVVRGQPAAQVNFVPARIGAGLIESVVFDDVPNGDFQDVFDDTTEDTATPPEHWAIGGGGTWGAAADVRQDVDPLMGRYLLFRATTNSVGMIASQFRVRLGTTSLNFSAYVMPSGTLGIGKNFYFNIEFYTDPFGNNFLGDTSAIAPNWYTPDVWTQFNQVITVPAGARYVRMTMNRETLDALHTWAVTGLTVFGNPITQVSARATSDAYLDTNDGTAHQIDTFTAADYQTNCDIDGGTSLLPVFGGMFMITVQAAWVSVDLSGVFFRTTELRVNGVTVGTLPTSAVDADNNAVDAGFFLVRLVASDSVEVWVTNAFFGGNDMNVIATVTLEKVAP